MTDRGPLVIGGVPGSGTRVYQQLAGVAGYTMLTRSWLDRATAEERRQSHDCRPLMLHFFPRWIDPWLGGELGPGARRRMRLHCAYLLRSCAPRRPRRWGFKNPRTIFLIRFFQEMYPSLRFIHVVRDPRDVVFHPEHRYDHHQQAFMTPDEIARPEPERRALYWMRVNEIGEREGRAMPNGCYLQTRLEDMCADPAGECARVLDWLGSASASAVARAVELVDPPSTLGRWRNESPSAIAAIEATVGETMERYGYETVDTLKRRDVGS